MVRICFFKLEILGSSIVMIIGDDMQFKLLLNIENTEKKRLIER